MAGFGFAGRYGAPPSRTGSRHQLAVTQVAPEKEKCVLQQHLLKTIGAETGVVRLPVGLSHPPVASC